MPLIVLALVIASPLGAHAQTIDLAGRHAARGEHDQAALIYEAVRDAATEPVVVQRAARGVVDSLEHLVSRAVRAGTLRLRDEPPPLVRDPTPHWVPIAIPALLQRLARARAAYLERVDPAHDVEHLRERYELANALLLHRHGDWSAARPRLTSIYEARCAGASAGESGAVAWQVLRGAAVELADVREVERLTSDLAARGCTFGRDPRALDAHVPFCPAGPPPRFLELHARARGETSETSLCPTDLTPERASAFVELADEITRYAARSPNGALTAHWALLAAIGLGCAGRHDASAALFERAEAEAPPDGGLPMRARVAFVRTELELRAHDDDRALAHLDGLVTGLCAEASEHELQQLCFDAQVLAGRLRARRSEHDRARAHYLAAARWRGASENEQALARFLAATALFRDGDVLAATRELRASLTEGSPWVEEHAVEARAMIARSIEPRRARARRRALEEVLAAFERGPERARFADAALAADAALTLADELVPHGRDPRAAAAERIAAYERVIEIGVAHYGVPALVRQGEIEEELAAEIAGTGDRVESEPRELVCRAAARYARALALAHAETADDAHSRRALVRLRAIGAETLGACPSGEALVARLGPRPAPVPSPHADLAPPALAP